MRTLVAMAWRNVLRNRRRSLLTAAAMGLAVAVVMAMSTLTEGMFVQMRDILVTRSIGHVQAHHPDWPGRRQLHDTLGEVGPRLAALDADPAVTAATLRLYGNALLGSRDRTEGAQLTGVEPSREDAVRRLAGDVVAGAWLADAPSAGIVLGADLASRLQVAVGDSIVAVTQAADGSLGNEAYDVVGLLRTGTPSIDRAGAFLHRVDLAELLALPDTAHELVVVGRRDDDAAVARLADAVRAGAAGRATLVRSWWEIDPTTAELFALQQFTGWIMLGFFFAVGAVGVVNTLLMSVLERTRELGVMRAIGMRRRSVVTLVLLEALFLGVLSVAAGAVLGGLLDAWLVLKGVDLSVQGKGYELGEMTFDPVIRGHVTVGSVVRPVVGVLFFSLVAAVWPALRAARLRPVDALREV